ncbi:MAG TPA: MFS transporter [Flavisolibacter sp.]|nr:MFS transporter [Flavisolibacter sp.]
MKNIPLRFTAYHKLVIVIVALMQFSIVLDFLIMAPLGNILIKDMRLSTAQFGTAVSVYAFSAGASGLLVAGFADRYPRKSLLLFAFTGFTAGTLLCGLVNSYPLLLLARTVAGIFGGSVFAMVGTVVADVFPFEQRGRVMGFVQLSFATCQVIGLPTGVFLSSLYGWHAPFFAITVLCVCIGLLIWKGLRPLNKPQEENAPPFRHLFNTAKQTAYRLPYVTTLLISLPGYMFMPFAAQYLVGNIGISQEGLGTVYLVVGICSAVVLPFIGLLCDRLGKWQTFVCGSVLACCMMAIYVNFNLPPLWTVALLTAVMYTGLLGRNVPSTALMTAVPSATDRGAFMSINSAMQQIGGGVSSVAAGYILTRRGEQVVHFETVGYICIVAMAICSFTVYRIYKNIVRREVVKEIESRVLLQTEAVDNAMTMRQKKEMSYQ